MQSCSKNSCVNVRYFRSPAGRDVSLSLNDSSFRSTARRPLPILARPTIFPLPQDRLLERVGESREAPVVEGAEVQLLVKAKVAEGFILDWRVSRLVGGLVAHVLHDDHRAFQAAQMSDVFQPVGEPVIAERHAADTCARGVFSDW